VSTKLAALDACLPQTQCQRCGFSDCLQYAQALLKGEAAINRCQPGGTATISMLAGELDQHPIPLDPELAALPPHRPVAIAVEECIGCTLCIQACPVDAITGAPRHMHTVLQEWCTGCALCLPACPVDCMYPQPATTKMLSDSRWPEFSEQQVARSRQRYQARNRRLQQGLEQRRAHRKNLSRGQLRDNIRAAVARTRARRTLNPGGQAL